MYKNIYPCIWMNGTANAAVNLYKSAFSNTIILADTPMVKMLGFGNQKLMLLDGGPHYQPNPSVSLYVVFETEEQIKQAFEMLSVDGKILMPYNTYPWSKKYVWLEDKFGVSWQLSFAENNDPLHRLSPVLMFTGSNAGKAEEAIQYYTALFPNSSVRNIFRYEAGDMDKTGYIKHAQFFISNTLFMAMDSFHDHKFNFSPGMSFVVDCDTQDEIDTCWNYLTAEGAEQRCGWLIDKYGASWQIVPSILPSLMQNERTATCVMNAMFTMNKFNIEALEKAAEESN